MADERARVVRDWLAAALALIGIVGGVGAGVVWVAERAVKDAVTEAVQPLHTDMQTLKGDVAGLKGEVERLKVAQSANPAVAAALFPNALWVPEFVEWEKTHPNTGTAPVASYSGAENLAEAPWAAEYRKWHRESLKELIP